MAGQIFEGAWSGNISQDRIARSVVAHAIETPVPREYAKYKNRIFRFHGRSIIFMQRFLFDGGRSRDARGSLNARSGHIGRRTQAADGGGQTRARPRRRTEKNRGTKPQTPRQGNSAPDTPGTDTTPPP